VELCSDCPPRLLAGDRGIHSTANEQYATKHGVKEVVLPKPGVRSAKRMAYAQQRWFRRGHNWRAGIEGRMSGLKRRHTAGDRSGDRALTSACGYPAGRWAHMV
jgi:IS5 family transposase